MNSQTDITVDGERPATMENEPGPSTPPPAEPAVVNVPKPLNTSSTTQGFIAATSLFPCVISGAILGYTALSMWDLPLNFQNSTWFASLAALGAAIGCLMAQSMMDAFGPRGTVLLSHVVCAIGWALTVSSSSATNFMVGRLLTGVFVGLVSVSASVHSAECFPARPSARPIVYTALGVLSVYLVGSLFDYAWTAFIALLATVGSFVFTRLYVPECPAWLESRGRVGDAEYAKLRLRLVTTTDREQFAAAADLAFLRHMARADMHRPFLALCTHFALQQLSGSLVLVTYAAQLVGDSGVRILNPYLIAVVLAVFLVAGSLVSVAMRHPESSATLSSAGTVTAVLIIAVYNLFRQIFLNNFASQLFSIVPLFGLVSFMAFSSTALVPNVPVKNVPGEHVAMAFSYVVAFLVIKIYPSVHSRLGWWVFVWFAAAAALNIVFGVLTFSTDTKPPKPPAPAKDDPSSPPTV